MPSSPERTEFVPGKSRYGRAYRPSLKARENMPSVKLEPQADPMSKIPSESKAVAKPDNVGEKTGPKQNDDVLKPSNVYANDSKPEDVGEKTGPKQNGDVLKPSNVDANDSKSPNVDDRDSKSKSSRKSKSRTGSSKSSSSKNKELQRQIELELSALRLAHQRMETFMSKMAENQDDNSSASSESSKRSHHSEHKQKRTQQWVDKHLVTENVSRRDGPMDWIHRLTNTDETTKPKCAGISSSTTMGAVCMDFANLAVQKKFDGSALDWVEWSLSFRNKVHDNPALTKSQKLSLLQESLGEGPKSRVFGLLWDTESYEIALQKLNKLYGNRHSIVEAYIREVRNWNSKDQSNISELGILVSKLVQVFSALGFDADLKGQALLCDLTSKLTFPQRKSWGRFVQRHGYQDVSLFEAWLAQEEEALRLGGALQKSTPKSAPHDRLGGSNSRRDYHMNGLGLGPDAPRKKCVFCTSDEHYIDSCSKFLSKSHSDRLKWYLDERRCYRCSRKGHRKETCRTGVRCRISDCGKPHASVLHHAFESNKTSVNLNVTDVDGTEPEKVDDSGEIETHVENVNLGNENPSGNCRSYLPILKVAVHSNNGLTLMTYALLDSGSQTTLISNNLCERLSLRGPTRRLAMKNVAHDIDPVQSKRVNFSVSDPRDPNKPALMITEAWSLASLNLPSQDIPRDSRGEPVWEHIKELGIPDVDSSQIELLIGANCKSALTQLQLMRAPPRLPDAVLTPLGWCLLGGHGSTESHSQNAVAIPELAEPEEPRLSALLEKFWSIDEFGCKFTDTRELSLEDRRALVILERETKLSTSGQYEVPMLWRDERPALPDNRRQAETRYQSLRRKLLKNPEQLKAYTETMRKYISEGYLQWVSPSEIDTKSELTHYLIHFGVTQPSKKKLRVVMDASLKYMGTSLNDHLFMGPFLTSSMVGLLLRFRRGRIAMSADIESMFHRVLVPEQTRQALRVLYSESMAPQPDTWQFQCHVFGAACSPSCATYALRRTAEDNVGKFPESSLYEIHRSFYVDDFITSCDDEKSAVQVVNDVIKVVGTGGFKLTKWVSTHQIVLDAAASSRGISTEVDLNLDDSPMSRVLGIHWSVIDDVIRFKNLSPSLMETSSYTKRSLVRLVCSIFDPLCFLSPFIVRARVMIQNLWSRGIAWDEEIDEETLHQWLEWISELRTIEKFSVPRKYWPVTFTPSRIDLHVFGDSSESAYAASCYVRVESRTGERHVSFVLARMRVAPLGKGALSLPRLELQAAVLASRLATTVCEEIDIQFEQVYFWSDSNIVLSYLANTKRRFKTFVGNRVAEIRSVSDLEQWRFCPGCSNPSDLATRGIPLRDLTANSPWLRGPEFLWLSENNWPKRVHPQELTAADPEVRAVGTAIVTQAFANPIDILRYSTLSRLLRVTAYCMRLMKNLRAKVLAKSGSTHKFLTGNLNLAEIYKARIFWIKCAQREAYGNDISKLIPIKADRNCSQKGNLRGSKIASLHPFLDHCSILRVGGRIYEAEIPYDAQHQIILPPNHKLTELLAHDVHTSALHCGPENIVASMRQIYWVPALRPVARKIINDCPPCKRENSRPSIPRMAPLPLARVQQDSIWGHTGMDVFGPIMIKQRRSRVKRWGILFCSMNVRAVHIEVLRSIDSDSFIMSLRRFIARRGEVSHLYCDSGSNFTGAAPELRAAIRQLNSDEKFRNYVTSREIEFHFMPPKASHFGGAWEILIKSIKRTLRIILRDHVVHEDTLTTVLCEVESAMNSRPISYVADDPEAPTPLTPNHFLHHAGTRVSPAKLPDLVDSSSRRRWRQSQIITEHLWKRWRREYLPSLNITQKWIRESRSLKVDDVVLIVDHNAPRGTWPIARVIEVHEGRDGRVRSAKLKTKGGHLTRPASLICVLEKTPSPNEKHFLPRP